MHPQQKYCFIVSWLLLALALLLFFTRCSPVQRLERMQKRHPYLFNKANDTIHYTDTVHISIPGTKVDTVIHENNIIDTITITKDNLIVQLWKVNDSIYVAGKTDTIYQKIIRKIEVPYTKYVTEKIPFDWKSLFRWLWIPIISGVGTYQLLKYLSKRM